MPDISAPLTTKLEAVILDGAPPNTILRCRVLNPQGQPVAAALVAIHGVIRNGSTRHLADKIGRLSLTSRMGEKKTRPQNTQKPEKEKILQATT